MTTIILNSHILQYVMYLDLFYFQMVLFSHFYYKSYQLLKWALEFQPLLYKLMTVRFTFTTAVCNLNPFPVLYFC